MTKAKKGIPGIGANLLAMRTKMKMTQRDVVKKAAKLGHKISERGYCNWELGTGMPTGTSMAKLSAIFGCSIADLMA